ncbi:YceK/YidQ family lipoprotein [Yersinia intermedia]|uniref:YceK/YidQ family lipoprotein n=1 Tax=Yersinia intermedia TaxID=631 RepID=UPI001F52F645|nr:YceK/YidQ family lipoprotein [Yersinia intermedia]UNK23504.1 YceK/YidQ family lipoprotein [Yersinia intermedia]
MRNTVIPFVTSCSLLFVSGCSSIMTHTSSSQGYYSGTEANVAMLKDDNTGWALRPLLAVDLPFSAVMDTLLLPYDYLRSDNEDKMASSPRERVRQSETQNQQPTQTVSAPIQ